jgi:hypothetical protein
VEPDPDAERALLIYARRVRIVALVGALAIVGFVVAALVDPNDLAPAENAADSAGSAAWAVPLLIGGLTAVLVAGVGLFRLRRRRRVLARSPLRRVTARWAPTRQRAQEIPGFVFEAADGSWQGVKLAATNVQSLRRHLREEAVTEIAEAEGDVVVRVPGSTALLTAKLRGAVDVADVPAPPGLPLVTLHAGEMLAISELESDPAPWFEDATRVPKGFIVRACGFAIIVLASVVPRAGRGALSVSDVVFTVGVLGVLAVAPAIVFASRRFTTVDRNGVTQTRNRTSQVVPLNRIVMVGRYPVEKPADPTNVVLTLEDDSTLRVETRRPDEFLAALQRGRVFS